MESSGRTLVCSVLFLDIVEYSKKPVAEQLELKQAFNDTLAKVLQPVAPRDRIILDTGDGAAVTFMGDPEDALFAAMAMRDAIAPVPVRLGVNLGAVRLVKDLNGQMNIIGDGINVAQRVMSFAEPGQLLVSRSFYEVVSCLSRDYAKLFRHEGARTDKHVREHDVYAVVGDAPARVGDTLSPPPLSSSGWFGFQRSAVIAAPIVFLLVVAGGVAGRALMEPEAQPAPPPVPVEKKATAVPAAKKVAKPTATARQGRLQLSIQPWGEVYVDGKSRGFSPPIVELDLPSGTHAIEIRNPTHPQSTYKARVEVKADGEPAKISHRFR